MAKHRVKAPQKGRHKGHKGLKIHGGFKSMEHKKSRRKKGYLPGDPIHNQCLKALRRKLPSLPERPLARLCRSFASLTSFHRHSARCFQRPPKRPMGFRNSFSKSSPKWRSRFLRSNRKRRRSRRENGDIRAILKERGMADADAEAMIGNPAYKTVLEAFVADAENGKTSLLKAQEIETNLKKWKTEVVDPHYLKKDQEYAEAQAKLAERTTYLKSLKAQGYEVPDAWLADGAPPVDPTKPAFQ